MEELLKQLDKIESLMKTKHVTFSNIEVQTIPDRVEAKYESSTVKDDWVNSLLHMWLDWQCGDNDTNRVSPSSSGSSGNLLETKEPAAAVGTPNQVSVLSCLLIIIQI